jgi:Fur family transcriptional regulator, ferric uptake regulator
MPWRDGTGPPWLHGKFKGCGYRMTMPRQIILDVLSGTADHLSAEDIYHKVHSAYPSIGLTTVYRTLELLIHAGLIHKFDFGDGRARYELVGSAETTGHHHHLVCTGCGRIIDYADFINEEIDLLKKTEKSLSKKYNFKITNHLIQFYGLCDTCRKQ